MAIRNVIVGGLCAAMLLACGGDASKVKDAVRQKLKDPNSAQFKEAIFSADSKRACIVWNAKNSMGGYGDWHTAELHKKDDSDWSVTDMESIGENCSETAFKGLDASDKAQFEARLKALSILEKVKNMPSNEIGEKCFGIIWKYSYSSGQVAKYRVHQNSSLVALYEKDLSAAQAKLDAGDCSR